MGVERLLRTIDTGPSGEYLRLKDLTRVEAEGVTGLGCHTTEDADGSR